MKLLNPSNIAGLALVFIVYGTTVWFIGLDDFARKRLAEFTSSIFLRTKTSEN
jgi:hypothetical protein